MGGLGALTFTTPWLLAGLLILPILWLILRAMPPAPVRRAFPGVALLLGLEDEDSEAARTPWWLLVLRLFAVAALIIGFAGLKSGPEIYDAPGDVPLLVLVDDSFAAAPDWSTRMEEARASLNGAAQGGRSVALVAASSPSARSGLTIRSAQVALDQLGALSPEPFPPDYAAVIDSLPGEDTAFDTLWISDGIAHPLRGELAELLAARGALDVIEAPTARLGLRPAKIVDGEIEVTALRSLPQGSDEMTVIGRGPDPQGIDRELTRAVLSFGPGDDTARARLSLPPELRNRISRFEIEGHRSAGAVTLTAGSLERRKVGLMSGGAREERIQGLSALYYLRAALAPTANVIEAPFDETMSTAPDAIILADVATFSPLEQERLTEWVAEGGLLVRFSGPRMAALSAGMADDDPLLPVRLRGGGRTVGGAMSWGEPRQIAPFAAGTPFYGLSIPEDVEVTSQVLAEPGPELSSRTIAALADGTPLVTRNALADGQIVLFHISANVEWSTLPLSGLFVQMLERLAISTAGQTLAPSDLAGTTWSADQVVDGYGRLADAGTSAGIKGEDMLAPASANLLPGLYTEGERRLAVNVLREDGALPAASWPASITPRWQDGATQMDFSGWLLIAALVALCLDVLASLWITGRLPHALRFGLGRAALLALGLMLVAPDSLSAQGAVDTTADPAAEIVTLAYVITGEGTVDRVSEAGLLGLSQQVGARTSVEPGSPVGIDLEDDNLALYPLLYWPIVETQATPSAAAYAKLNAYMRGGGLILFDTRDGDIAGFGSGATPEGAKLRQLALPLDIPPLDVVPLDHVLTRTFYLLNDFPGRSVGQPLWAEASVAEDEVAEGMPFRNLNDGVTPVLIGGNDWASAWAISQTGAHMFPVGRGFAGEMQREYAYRFGVNLVMHVLTGNYKSDQVHVPALLERLEN